MVKTATKTVFIVAFILLIVYVGLFTWFRVTNNQVQHKVPSLAQETYQTALPKIPLVGYLDTNNSMKPYWAPAVDEPQSTEYMKTILWNFLKQNHSGPIKVVPGVAVLFSGSHQVPMYIYTTYSFLWFNKTVITSQTFYVAFYKKDNRTEVLR